MISKRILVIDDEEDFLTVVDSRLRARHYKVDCTTQIDQAYKWLAQKPPDMVLVGYAVWKSYAHELMNRIRGSLGTSTTPIILLAEHDEVAGLIMSMDKGLDDFIVKPTTPLELQLRIALNFHRNEERIQANPLTKLPGNVAIDKEIRSRIESKEPFAVCYVDIDNFKAYNDSYGFDRGDDVLLQTANIIRRTASLMASEAHAFVGHIGGDDFLVILDPKHDHLFATACIREFERIVGTYYKSEDQKRGTVTVKNRKGKISKTPLMSLSIAAVTNENRRLESPAQIGQIAAEVKEYLKTQPGSNFLRDRREQPMRDLDTALTVLRENGKDKKKKDSGPLGQILLAAGLLNDEQLSRALDQHFKTGQRLGQVLVGMNLCTSEDVGRMLQRKLGVTYISLKEKVLSPSVRRLFTQEYVRTHRVCPIENKNKRLYLAMLDPFDIKTIDYIERITGFKVVPCIALEDEFEAFLELNFSKERAPEPVPEPVED